MPENPIQSSTVPGPKDVTGLDFFSEGSKRVLGPIFNSEGVSRQAGRSCKTSLLRSPSCWFQ